MCVPRSPLNGFELCGRDVGLAEQRFDAMPHGRKAIRVNSTALPASFGTGGYAAPAAVHGACGGRSTSLERSDCAAWQNFTRDPLYAAWAEAQCGSRVHADPCSCAFADQTQCAGGRITHINMFGRHLPGRAGIPAALLRLTGPS